MRVPRFRTKQSRAETVDYSPARLIDEVPVEDGGVILVKAAIDSVLAVGEGVQVLLVHLAALIVGVEVILASGS